jgi:hypothetical protein
LEAWTNTSFNFDSDIDSYDHKSSSSGGLDLTLSPGATLGKHGLDSNYSFGLGSDVDIESLLAPSTFGSGSQAAVSFDTTGFIDHAPSLVDPELHLPLTSAPAGLSANDRIAPGLLVHAPSTYTPSASIAPAAVIQAPTAAAPSPAKSTPTAAKKAVAPKKRKTSSAATAAGSANSPAAATTAASSPKAADVVADTPKPVAVGAASTPATTAGGVDADEAANALAIEEDKRRRNTAASARFRVKKKQREQALEQSAKELRERVAQLENEVGQLRTENAWLKGLIVEKPAGDSIEVPTAGKKRSADEITV